MKILMALFIALLFLTACSVKTIADIKNTDNVGKKVTVHGTVDSSFKIGSLSGYNVKDDTDKIGVSAETLPKEGTTITVTGTLMKDTIFGYYIKADE